MNPPPKRLLVNNVGKTMMEKRIEEERLRNLQFQSTVSREGEEDEDEYPSDVISFSDAFSVGGMSDDDLMDDDSFAGSDMESPTPRLVPSPSRPIAATPVPAEVAAEPEPEPETKKPVTHLRVVLAESDTITLLSQPNIVYPTDGVDTPPVVQANERYAQVLEKYRLGETVVDRGVQTVVSFTKDKKSATNPITKAHKQVAALEVEIFDSLQALEEEEVAIPESGPVNSLAHAVSGVNDDATTTGGGPGDDWDARSVMTAYTAYTMTANTAPSEAGTIFTGTGLTAGSQTGGASVIMPAEGTASMADVGIKAPNRKIMHDPTLPNVLRIAERIIHGNTYETKLKLWSSFAEKPQPNATRRLSRGRSLSIAQGSRRLSTLNRSQGIEGAEARVPGFEPLWTSASPCMGELDVTAMAWGGPRAPDLLAVAYGRLSFNPGPQDVGTIAVWTPRNPAHPELVLRVPCLVVSLAWSPDRPQALAAGMHDGRVCLYDVLAPVVDLKTGLHTPALSTSFASRKHQDAVWAMAWIQASQAATASDLLLSVSSDGRVTQRSLKKSLSPDDIMLLKTTGSTHNPIMAGESPLAKVVAGLALGVTAHDRNVYLVGTDDGAVYRCSRTYNEQYLSTYYGHNGSVTSVAYSPFTAGVFLTSSTDGTVRVWEVEESEPILAIQHKDCVTAAAWCPFSATVFVTGTTGGELCLWDLAYSVTEPVMQLDGPPVQKLAFNGSSAVLSVGYSGGKVMMLHLTEIPYVDATTDAEEQADLLNMALEQLRES
ncbi:WD domain, G-beta repeat [Carpediemonas membranifera]|uniref:Dynein axonemal intermediate chain 4 n=1 Tax=Carpediemonas membranifera TaxID=201153 RepID=A0A8J6B784_9EUKA|nr:WD domain, G-beta repeat [Carpediemonas membranifera]|eukprot:KAG9391437.1 WD domain, G-beta repeat [Carpediemonas membranifera]